VERVTNLKKPAVPPWHQEGGIRELHNHDGEGSDSGLSYTAIAAAQAPDESESGDSIPPVLSINWKIRSYSQKILHLNELISARALVEEYFSEPEESGPAESSSPAHKSSDLGGTSTADHTKDLSSLARKMARRYGDPFSRLLHTWLEKQPSHRKAEESLKDLRSTSEAVIESLRKDLGKYQQLYDLQTEGKEVPVYDGAAQAVLSIKTAVAKESAAACMGQANLDGCHAMELLLME